MLFDQYSRCFEYTMDKLTSELKAKQDEEKKDKEKEGIWDNVEDKFKQISKRLNEIFFVSNPFFNLTRILAQLLQVIWENDLQLTLALSTGSLKQIRSLSKFFQIQSDFHEKLGLPSLTEEIEKEKLSSGEFNVNVYLINRHLSWYVGQFAYNYIQIKQDKKEIPKSSENKTSE